MSEYEYMILLSTLKSEAAVHGEHVVTAISAYVLVVFFASNKLPTLFTSLLTLVYSCFMIVPVYSSYAAADQAIKVGIRYSTEYPEGFRYLKGDGNFTEAILVLYFVAWLLSICFAIYRFRSARLA
ncbi:MAG: hypothetical protein V7459_17650 [Oceanicoccus sp.]